MEDRWRVKDIYGEMLKGVDAPMQSIFSSKYIGYFIVQQVLYRQGFGRIHKV